MDLFLSDNGFQLDLTQAQADQLVKEQVIYFCDSDGHECYHIAPEFLAKHKWEPEEAWFAIDNMPMFRKRVKAE